MPSASPPPKKAVTLSTVAEMGSPLHLTTNGPLLGGDAPPRPPPAAPPGAAPPDPAIPSGADGAAAEGSLGDGAEPMATMGRLPGRAPTEAAAVWLTIAASGCAASGCAAAGCGSGATGAPPKLAARLPGADDAGGRGRSDCCAAAADEPAQPPIMRGICAPSWAVAGAADAAAGSPLAPHAPPPPPASGAPLLPLLVAAPPPVPPLGARLAGNPPQLPPTGAPHAPPQTL